MEATFRKSMAGLHTWAGVLIGSLLFAIFWMGTLSVFDREIDRWMMPGTRLATPGPSMPSLDRTVLPAAEALAAGAAQWGVNLPTERVPTLRFSYRNSAGDSVTRHIDPSSGALVADQGSLGGTGFIFPFHFKLNLKWLDLGYWFVGLAGMSMLVLLVSGVIIHKKIFSEFFTFRPRKKLQRASLDLHNLTGVVALPFHFMIALSGLIIFIGIYFPQSHVGAYGFDKAAKTAYSAEAYGQYRRVKAGAPGQLSSLDAMMARAERAWPGGKPFFARVWHPGDANSYVEIRRSYAHDITMNLDQLYFDAASGALLKRFEAAPVMTVQRFISGLHFIQFEHWSLRWLYFLAGLSGCVMIATGFLFWLEARRAQHAKKGLAGVRLVEGLTVGSVTGIIIATLIFFASNRLMPLGSTWVGYQRLELEVWCFYLSWILSFIHAWARPGLAWREQAWAVAALALLCVLLNAVTTGDHLLRSYAFGLWSVAGVDTLLLLMGLCACGVALRLQRQARAGALKPVSPQILTAAERT